MPTPDFVLALRRRIGQAELWLPGVTAVVRRGPEVLLVRRADNGAWTPVTGIVEPGEDPGACARREVLEETGVVVRVDRLASVTAEEPMVHANGDRAVYLDHTYACTWLSGEAHVADDESVDVGWYAVGALPDLHPGLAPRFAARIEAALSDEVATRFRT